MKSIHAVYEDGVFRPIEAVELPEHCHVEFEPRVIEPDSLEPSLHDVYSILNERFESGERDVAARHDEAANNQDAPWESLEREFMALSVEGTLPPDFSRADVYSDHD